MPGTTPCHGQLDAGDAFTGLEGDVGAGVKRRGRIAVRGEAV